MPNRGSYNRRTGKSTPRNKVKTHWGGKRSPKSGKVAGKPATKAAPAAKK